MWQLGNWSPSCLLHHRVPPSRSFSTFRKPRNSQSAYQTTDWHQPDLQKELTFKSFGLLGEIRDVLEDQLAIRTPSPIQ